MNNDPEIQHILDNTTASLTALFKKRALGVFESTTAHAAPMSATTPTKKAAAKKAAVKKAAPVTRAKGAKRDPAVMEATMGKITEFLTANANSSIEQINAGLGTTTKDLSLPMKKLIGAKKVKTVGHKRATRYSIK
jgi:hypothetical protein